MDTCPSEELLQRFLGGAVVGDELGVLESHLGECSSCGALVAHLAGAMGSTELAQGSSGRLASTPALGLQPGTRVGRYSVLERVGVGGMGEVYAAYDPQLDRRVALKLRRPHRDRQALEQRLVREAQAMARLDHPNVVPVHDVGEHEGQAFVAMAFVAGSTLRVWLRESRSWREILDAFLSAGDGLAAAHDAGIIHRDFKPENVLVDERGLVRVTDFGLARTSTEPADVHGDNPIDTATGLTEAGAVVGTPAFMAPEQMRGGELDPRADVFAFCVALWSSLYGQLPYGGQTMQARLDAIEAGTLVEPPAHARVPRWVRGALAHGLRPRPEDRPVSMRALLGALRTDPAVRRRRILAVAGVAGVAGTALIVGATVRSPSPGRTWRPNVREMLPAYDENSDVAAISPDGKRIVYPSNREGEDQSRLFVGPLEEPSRALTPPQHFALFPRWTSDGSAIYYVDQRMWTAHRIPAEGGAPEAVTTGVHDVEVCGDRLVFNRMTSPGCPTCQRLVVVDGTSEREVVRGGPGEWILEPRCDRAGERLLYGLSPGNSNQLPSSDLWIVGVRGGAPRRLTARPELQNRYGEWTPDGSSIIFSASQGAQTNLWELSVAGGGRRQLTEGEGPDLAPIITPDGRWVVFNRDITATPLLAYRQDGAGPRKLTFTLDQWSDPRAALDGREVVAIVTRRSRKYVVALPLAGGQERMIGEGTAPALTLDDEHILFSPATAPNRLVKVPRRGEAPPQTLADLPSPIEATVVGPDGFVHLRLRRDESFEAWRVPLAGGAPSRDAPSPWCHVVPAPRGGWVAAVRCKGIALTIDLVSPGGALDQGVHSLTGRHFTWDADGSSLVYSDGRVVHRYDLATGTDTRLITTGISLGLDVSPDKLTLYVPVVVGHVRRQIITNFADRPRP